MIFPTMRRGGRKVYAFNVTNPRSPIYSWSKGCPNATNDTGCDTGFSGIGQTRAIPSRSEEHTSELQSLMRISYAVFCLKKKHKRTKSRIAKYATSQQNTA